MFIFTNKYNSILEIMLLKSDIKTINIHIYIYIRLIFCT